MTWESETVYYFCSAAAFVIAFVSAFFLTRAGIPYLRRKKMGQTILEVGPDWHKKKEGTPTMGGIFFVAAAFGAFLLSTLLFVLYDVPVSPVPFAVGFLALANAAVGFADDLVKFTKKQNQGLTPLQKLIFQFGSAAVFLLLLHLFGELSTELLLPFGLGTVDLGIFYYLFALILIVLFVNAVNLTDGLDGLAASNASIVLVFFYLIFGVFSLLPALQLNAVFSVCVLGAVLAFLCFNRYPAQIFMGDTGSLFLGAVIAGLAVSAGLDLLLVFCGVLFLFEALSVILQVGFFKLTHGRRLFKMAPFHHHLEKCGWSENRIVFLFCLVTTLGCVIAAFVF